jgi:hypothetical protein
VPLGVEEYRRRLEEMNAEILEEEYRHFAGLKPTYEVAEIYRRNADLGAPEQVEALSDGAPRELLRFAAETHIGNGLRELSEQLANTEAVLTVDWDGGALPYRAVRPAIMNEPDRARRLDLHRRRCAATEEHLNPILEETETTRRALTAGLGHPSTLALYERLGVDPVGLRGRTEEYLDATEDVYRRELERALRSRLGIDLGDASPADMSRLFRAPELDHAYPTGRMVHALRATLAELGIDLASQDNVVLDIEARPGKVPRAFCAPVRVPSQINLVILPQGGPEDYAALFHEAGHTEHFAHTSPDLPAEDRLLGDNAVTEGWASLLENLVFDPAWLSARLDLGGAGDIPRFSGLTRLFFTRRYSAKLAYEIELHSGRPLDELPDLYAERLSAATLVPYSPTDFLEDVDPGFYVTAYLRSWAFEAQMRDLLRTEFGSAWFRREGAGELLRELWALGQSQTADRIARDVTGSDLELGILADDIRATLR